MEGQKLAKVCFLGKHVLVEGGPSTRGAMQRASAVHMLGGAATHAGKEAGGKQTLEISNRVNGKGLRATGIGSRLVKSHGLLGRGHEGSSGSWMLGRETTEVEEGSAENGAARAVELGRFFCLPRRVFATNRSCVRRRVNWQTASPEGCPEGSESRKLKGFVDKGGQCRLQMSRVKLNGFLQIKGKAIKNLGNQTQTPARNFNGKKRI